MTSTDAAIVLSTAEGKEQSQDSNNTEKDTTSNGDNKQIKKVKSKKGKTIVTHLLIYATLYVKNIKQIKNLVLQPVIYFRYNMTILFLRIMCDDVALLNR